MDNKEHNFVSAVIYVQKWNERALSFYKDVQNELEKHFLQYEIIVVDATDRTTEWKNEIYLSSLQSGQKPLTILKVLPNQSEEQCLNAGVDLSIGDYVYEFNSVQVNFPMRTLYDAYLKALEGSDIVMTCPKTEKMTSRLFYRIFNACSHSTYSLRTDAFSLISRRALDRLHMISNNLLFRKAAYATCGLKIAELEITESIDLKRMHKFDLAVDSLLLYTDFGYKIGLGLTSLMLVLTLCLFVYALLEKLVGNPIEGWTSLACIITFAFSGIFAIMVILMKYLTLLLRISFKKQSYLIERIDKI